MVTDDQNVEEINNEVSTVHDDQSNDQDNYQCDKFPKKKTVVQYATIDNGIQKAEILSSQPKRTGQYGRWVNV